MESQIRYIDELIAGFNGSCKIERVNEGNCAAQSSNTEERKLIQAVQALLRILNDLNHNSADLIFQKCLGGLDRILHHNPYIMALSISSEDSGNLMIMDLIDKMLGLAERCSYNIHRMWYIRRNIIRWITSSTRLFGSDFKRIINLKIKKILNELETKCKLFLFTHQNVEPQEFISTLTLLHTILYWISADSNKLGDYFYWIQGSSSLNEWDLHFQKYIRIAMYLFASFQIKIDANSSYFEKFNLLQANFIMLVANYQTSRTLSGGFNSIAISIQHLKFTLEVISEFMRNRSFLSKNETLITKSLLKMYYLSVCKASSNKNDILSIFLDYIPVVECINSKHQFNENYDSELERSLLLLYFDMKRRYADPDELQFIDSFDIWSHSDCIDEVSIITQPIKKNSKQIEKLQRSILKSYTVNIKQIHSFLFKELNSLEPGILDRNGDHYKAVVKEISISIKRSLKIRDSKKIITWLRVLSRMACIEDKLINTKQNISEFFHTTNDFCNYCDSIHDGNFLNNIEPSRPLAQDQSEIFSMINKYFILNPDLKKFSMSIKCGLFIVIERIFAHFQPTALMNENNQIAPLFSFIEDSFIDSDRHVRLLICKILPLWNTSNHNNSEDEMSMHLIQFLQKVNSPLLLETVVLSWSKITLTTHGDVFDTLLLKLIDLFNSNNFTLHIMMKEQLIRMSSLLNKTPYQLLSPVLPIILRQLSKNLNEKKLSFQRLCDLVGYTGKVILDIFQKYVIPYATVQYKSDVFSEVAKIMCDDDTSMLLQQKHNLLTKNSRQIFAVALVKHGFFSLDTMETLFLNRVPSYDRRYIGAYLPDYKTLAEVTKLYKNNEITDSSDIENENMVLCSLRYLITNFESDKRHGTEYKDINKWSDKKENQFQNNLQDNILGIFQVFSSDMHDVEGKTTYYEKLRVINGISFLVKHASNKCIISALAQLSICLQSGLEIPEVRYLSMRCWFLLIQRLNEEELTTVIDAPVAFILRKWPTFNKKLQLKALEVLTALIRTKNSLLMKMKPYISISLLSNESIPILDIDTNFSRQAARLRNTIDLVPIFVKNLQSNNKFVIEQNLDDIKFHLKRRQGELLQYDKYGNLQLNAVPSLIGALLEVAHKYRTIDHEICKKCAKCISMVGVPDIRRIDLRGDRKEKWKVFDFNDYSKTTEFLIWLIDDILVPSFWQSENPNKQLFFALVMQESLKYCGLSSQSWDINEPDKFPEQLELWNKFNSISKTTLYPLLSSLYLAQSWKEYVPIKYPSLNFRDGYKTWIKNFTLDLLKTGTTEDHPLHVFSSLIREDDGSLSSFLLPYIAQDIIIKAQSGTEYESLMDNILIELQSVVTYEIDGLNHLQRDSLKMCYEAVFSILEYCKKWATMFRQDYNNANGTFLIKEDKYLKMLKRIDYFINSIPLDLLANKSLETNAFERSALYLEECYRHSDIHDRNLNSTLKSLQMTYEEIGDIDSIDGLLKSFASTSFETKIEELQYSNKWQMALECFDILADITKHDSTAQIMTKSMFDHHLYKNVIQTVPKLVPDNIQKLNESNTNLLIRALESSILEGDLKSIEKWSSKIELMTTINDPELTLQYNLGKALLSISKGNHIKAGQFLDNCYQITGIQYTSTSNSTTLLKTQSLLTKLHGLHDLNMLNFSKDDFELQSNMQLLDLRRGKVGPDFDPNYYILSIRKTFDKIHKNPITKTDLVDTYFAIAQEARVNSRLDIASKALIFCLEKGHPYSELEFAEILWKDGENDRALKLVREINQKNEKSSSVSVRNKAEVLLKYTEWLDISNNSASEQIITQYKNIFALEPEWEQPYYSIGLYFSRLLERRKAEGYVSDGKLEFKSISYFLLAFEKNTVKVRENLPKVITFWLDTAAAVITETSPNRNTILKKVTSDICKQIETAIRNCPTYIWYSVLTQLLSRLLHPHLSSAKLIMHILLSLAVEYPSHILWHISVLCQSNSSKRVKCGQDILEKFRAHSDNQEDIINSSIYLTSSLTRICLQEVKSSSSRSGRSLVSDFKFDVNIAPTPMTVPVRKNLEMISPLSAETMKSYQPFRPTVSIAKFASSYKIFSSLKKPKKITIIGSDGMLYEIMCKKEDVRQDNQYMQFAATMDFLLSKDLDSSKRDLGITVYSVLSLREDCGLLEIVPDVVTLRSIFTTKYESKKIKYSMKALYEKWQGLADELKPVFFNEQTKKFSPVLHEWFLENFPDPINWYRARNLYSRSYAVMAMVGYILGLGDRHCENILLDIKTGKVLHVDFDCLFEKGENLPVPEIVPFRLTQNLQDALGILGTEGTFKKSSEVTLSLMRQNEVALMNIIETIMYDRNMDHSIQKALRKLRNKIRGIDPRDGLLLSVSGQAETLIQEATSTENLSKMYIGWLPFW
ncbi:Phosphatidylinositol 3- and 4-kinases family profile [Nakaseomyces glabratus]|nr:Phosphatidylinositol 3- and 4-kinases family profile [Nakaseomyces glabratus]KAH7598084.1 Phosphatidylinositol 3- and 4-kinases family profile [Nakaseomyces glabratus]